LPVLQRKEKGITMGRPIVKLAEDKFVEWSSICDAPYDYGFSYAEGVERYGWERMERANLKGTSLHDKWDQYDDLLKLAEVVRRVCDEGDRAPFTESWDEMESALEKIYPKMSEVGQGGIYTVVPNEGGGKQVMALSVPDLDVVEAAILADAAKVKTWKQKAEFYEQILRSATQLFHVDVPMDDQDTYKQFVLLHGMTAANQIVVEEELVHYNATFFKVSADNTTS